MPTAKRRPSKCFWCKRPALKAVRVDGYTFCSARCLGESDAYEEEKQFPLFGFDEIFARLFGKSEVIVKAVGVVIEPEMYKKLLMLCHPDKHGNSKTSTEVTQWLLEERKRSEASR